MAEIRRESVGRVFCVVALLLLAGCAMRSANSAPPPEALDVSYFESRWLEVEDLIDEQKYNRATEVLAELRAEAQEAGAEVDWARALVREVQLTAAQGGVETAVHLLGDAPWPEDPEQRTVLRLLYADSLAKYLDWYGWDIGQRERIGSAQEVDLDQWTRDQIVTEVDRAFRELWTERASWADRGLGELDEYFTRGGYPERIRGTLRDVVGYLWVEFLANTGYWSGAENNTVYRLDMRALAAGAVADGSHPLERLTRVLADLEGWHLEGDRPEAALEAVRSRVERLEQHAASEEDRSILGAELETAMESLGSDHAWWSMGQAKLAELTRAGSGPDALVQARDLAILGERAHPGSVGGQHCKGIRRGLEASSMSLASMRVDGPRQRSLQITHRNVSVVHLRAYRLDLAAILERGDDYNLLPTRRTIESLLRSSKPTHEWLSELAPTPDLRPHRTFVTPPMSEGGLYVIVASAREDFRERNNRLEGVNFILSDLVVLARHEEGAVMADIRSGATGEGLDGAAVELWRMDYRKGHQRESGAITGPDGRVSLKTSDSDSHQAFVVARKGEEIGFEQLWVGTRSRPERDRTDALVFTDRSIYRPDQQMHWKAVVYERLAREQRLEASPDRSVTVELIDANGEVVDSAQVRTNGFGSASGAFKVPAGRLLGSWSLRTSAGGGAQVRVEEYKRPTFEVALVDPDAALRLNHTARLTGDAQYYFGLPVVEGAVEWSVSRRPRYPYWWGWFRAAPSTQAQLLAGGEASLDADGRFEFEFTAEADEREARDGVSYSYAVTVHVTDAGGETRSAERTYQLGYVAVQAVITGDLGFFEAGADAGFDVRRTDLDGTPRRGQGRWRLLALVPPESALMPADYPVEFRDAEGQEFHRTPGDLQQPRWGQAWDTDRELRSWPDGEQLAAGRVEHGEAGDGRIEIENLAPGSYRLYYETDDAWGSTFETQREFLVTGADALPLAAVLAVERTTVSSGGLARVLVHSGLPDQDLLLEIARPNQPVEERRLTAGRVQTLELAIGEKDRGGLELRLTVLNDHQLVTRSARLFVPPEVRDLGVRFSSFRDLMRPGGRESWRVEVSGADGARLGAGAAEVLSYMYDRSLDLFAPHTPPRPAGFGLSSGSLAWWSASLGLSSPVFQSERDWNRGGRYAPLQPDRLVFFDSYGIGGPGLHRLESFGGSVRRMAMPASASSVMEMADGASPELVVAEELESVDSTAGENRQDGEGGDQLDEGSGLRSDFSETAFWEPHLVTGEDGSVAFEFTVPDSVTEWNVWVHALTQDLSYGSLHETSRSVKELLVRPYLPRFLREGDQALLRVVVQNAGEETLSGTLDLDLTDPTTEVSVAADFGLADAERQGLGFSVEPGGSATLTVPVLTPTRVGGVAVRTVAEAGDYSDGELRLLPLLPGRFHLLQSRFAALQDATHRDLVFEDLAADDDSTRIDEQLVVTLDAQLFYSVLSALPYLADYPYECTEQTLNRFLSTGIVSSVFEDYPAVAQMASQLAARETPLEPWVADDPNRRMALEETPWLRQSRGGGPDAGLLRILDPGVARAQREAALARLASSQTSSGGFPWWPGGPPSPYMTLYITAGLSRALEFGVDVPREPVVRAWQYLQRYYIEELVDDLGKERASHHTVTLLNYVLSNYPDTSWTGGVFNDRDRERMLNHSFEHWRLLSPRVKSHLALTLERSGRGDDAKLVFDSVMDSARTTVDEGTFWAPEDRAWLWYNDTIETHAFALRTLTELDPMDSRRQGLVHWLMLNKKLNHWKSTRATAEVIYSLVHYLSAEGELGVREAATVSMGEARHDFAFEPDEYTGRNQQVVVAGSEIVPGEHSTIRVEKETPGLMFASATWHFSTEVLPESARSDFFGVERSYFKRVRKGEEFVLEPLAEGAELEVGDQVEVHLVLRSKHAAEYVHLRDPRAAGFEPEALVSRYQWGMGTGWYEQVRDSGTDFFFEWLPVGEYTFRYRLRANLSGTFKAAPAVVQSMYAPEFAAYSSGTTLQID